MSLRNVIGKALSVAALVAALIGVGIPSGGWEWVPWLSLALFGALGLVALWSFMDVLERMSLRGVERTLTDYTASARRTMDELDRL